MTRDQLTTLLPVMIAWKEGKPIQKRHILGVGGSIEWHDVVGEDPHFECDYAEWRVKPEPREWVICNNCGYSTFVHQPLACPCHAPVTHVREVHLSKEAQ